MPSAADRLRVGLLGYGAVGRRRRSVIDARPDLITTAICDAAGVPDAAGAIVAPDLESLLREPLDALFVCATPAVAPVATIAALERGLHVFCEKPPARTPEELEAVLRVEARHPRQVLQYGFNHRLHGSVRKARETAAGGSLGQLVSLRGVYGKSTVATSPDSWRAKPEIAGGGILLDQGIHLADLMLLFAGEFETVHAFVDARTHGLPVEDNAWALMRTRTGIVAQLHSSATEWRPLFLLELNFTNGALVLDGMLSSTGLYAPERLVVRLRYGQERLFDFTEDFSWRDEIDSFAASIRTGAPVRDGSSQDALAVMRLVFQIYESGKRARHEP